MPKSHSLHILLLAAILFILAGCQDISSQDSTDNLPVTFGNTINDTPVVIPDYGASENGNNATSPVGINSNYLKYWTPEWIFVDAFKSSREWVSILNGVRNSGQLDIDSNGWVRSLQPGQEARTVMFWFAGDYNFAAYPAGQYTVFYDGEGSINYGGGARFNSALSRPGRHILDVTPTNGGISLTITATNPANPIRNIRVIMPGGVCSNNQFQACSSNDDCSNGASCELFVDNYQQQIFHPTFMDRLKRYSTYRFMNWMKTNETDLREWQNRPRVSDARWSTDKGAPLEIMVAFANRMNMDPWFSFPHEITDDYVRRSAEYIRDNLKPGLKVYIEYSNEVWNSNFPQTRYAEDQGLALGLHTNRVRAGAHFYSMRSTQIFDIFTEVFGGNERLVRVIASHARNDTRSRWILEFNNAYAKTDALAIAPYFGGYLGRPANVDRVQNMTLDQLFDVLRNEAIPEAIGTVSRHAQIAREYNLQLIAYEGGQHLVGTRTVRDNAQINRLFDQANRDPRMGEMYTLYLNGWRQNGGQLFMQFYNVGGYSRFGRWGALEYQTQPITDAPKYGALMNFIQNNPRWW